MAVLRTLQIFFCSFTKLKFGQSFRDAKHAKTHERQRILHRVVFFTKSQKSENKNICVLHLTFELIKIQTCLIPQNDRLNLSFFEKYTCSWQKKMTRSYLKTAIYHSKILGNTLYFFIFFRSYTTTTTTSAEQKCTTI